jgi:hypothetical protein
VNFLQRLTKNNNSGLSKSAALDVCIEKSKNILLENVAVKTEPNFYKHMLF